MMRCSVVACIMYQAHDVQLQPISDLAHVQQMLNHTFNQQVTLTSPEVPALAERGGGAVQGVGLLHLEPCENGEDSHGEGLWCVCDLHAPHLYTRNKCEQPKISIRLDAGA